jgi:hypothetical protein
VKGLPQNNRLFFAQYNGGTGAQTSWFMRTLSVSPGDKVTVCVTDNQTTSKDYFTNSIVFDNNWHHIGFTWNNGILKLYVDGVEVAVTKSHDDAIVTLYNANSNLTIGSALLDSSPHYFFTGQIDDARLYNQPIPTSQIQENYYSGINRLLSKDSIGAGEYVDKVSQLRDSISVNP